MDQKNQVTITGYLPQQPVLRYHSDASTLVTFSVALKGQGGAIEYFDVVAYGAVALFILGHSSKKTKVEVQGYLRQNRWTDKVTGKERYKTVIVAEKILLLG